MSFKLHTWIHITLWSTLNLTDAVLLHWRSTTQLYPESTEGIHQITKQTWGYKQLF